MRTHDRDTTSSAPAETLRPHAAQAATLPAQPPAPLPDPAWQASAASGAQVITSAAQPESANDPAPGLPFAPEVYRWLPLVVPLLAVMVGGMMMFVWAHIF